MTMQAEAGALLARGHALAWQDRWEEAVELFRAAAQADGGDSRAWRALGLACLHLDRLEEGAEALESARMVGLEDALLLERLAGAYAVLERRKEAAAVLARLARVHRAAGETGRALEALREGSALDPDEPGHARLLSDWLAELGRSGQAAAPGAAEVERPVEVEEALIDRARSELLEAVFQGGEEWLVLAQGLEAHLGGRWAAAAERLQAASGARARGGALPYLTAIALLRAGGQEAALAHLEEAAGDEAYGAAAASLLAPIYLARGEPDRAIRHLMAHVRALELALAGPERREELAARYAALDAPQAVAALQPLLEAGEGLEGAVDRMRERLDRMEAVRELMVVEGMQLEARGGLLGVLEESYRWASRGNLIQARESCQRALESHPDALPLQRRLAELLEAEGRAAEAGEKYLHLSRVYRLRDQPSQAGGCDRVAARLRGT